MEIRYITTDLDLDSKEDLSPLVAEIGERLLPSHNGWVNEKYFVVLACPTDHDAPEETIAGFCKVIESLSKRSQVLWKGANSRVLDIAFESGESPNRFFCQLPDPLISRLSALGVSIAISIYPIGHYSNEAPEVRA